jgi:hypothetical protein
MLVTTRQRLRDRQLAGDGRAGQWARDKARRQQWHFIRQRWRLLATAAMVVAVLTAVVVTFLNGAFERGFILGASFAGTIGALTILVMQVTGSAPTSMGATAEQWTASELRPLRKAGWQVINHVALQKWDIDHVLIGPAGVIAVETKWSAGGWTLDPPDPRVQNAVARVRRNAKNLRYWHPLQSLGIGSVSSVVFLWGGSQPDAPPKPATPHQLGDVQVVHGLDAARAWRAQVARIPAQESFGPDQIRRACAALDTHIRERDERDTATTPALPSLKRLYFIGLAVVLSFISSLLASLQARKIVESWWLWWPILAALACIGAAAYRVRSARLLALGWVSGVVAAAVLGAGLLLYTSW